MEFGYRRYAYVSLILDLAFVFFFNKLIFQQSKMIGLKKLQKNYDFFNYGPNNIKEIFITFIIIGSRVSNQNIFTY